MSHFVIYFSVWPHPYEYMYLKFDELEESPFCH